VLVTSNADNGAAGTLRWAVQQAKKNDTIVIETTQTIVLTQGQIVVREDVTIEAAKNTTATVSGGFTSRIFEVASSGVFGARLLNVTFNHLDLINGHVSGGGDDGDGGAVEDFVGTLTLNNCSFSGNAAVEGGAIADEGGNLTVNNCAFSANTASAIGTTPGLGGAIAAFLVNLVPISDAVPTMSINNSTFSGNTATEGGAIYDNPEVSTTIPQMAISGCSFSGNSATNGGAVYLEFNTGPVNISNSSFVNNTATQQGGAIFVSPGAVRLTVTQDTFAGNTPNNIYGPYIDGGGNMGL
jgi:predicted outer membrane repeat protein